MPAILPQQILKVTLDYLQKKEIDPPVGLEDDFMNHFGNEAQSSSLQQLHQRVCKEIDLLLQENSELSHKYQEFLDLHRKEIKWQIALVLKNPAEVIKNFLKTLNKGQEWSIDDFLLSGKEAVSVKSLIYSFDKGPMTLDLFVEILADEACLLDDYVFIRKDNFGKKRQDWDSEKIKGVLKRYLATLKNGQSWNSESFMASSQEAKSAYNWLYSKRKTGITIEEKLKKTLDQEGEALWACYPYVERKWNMLKARAVFKDFFAYLKSKGLKRWSPTILDEWSPEGENFLGENMHRYFKEFFRYPDKEGVDWSKVLADLVDPVDMAEFKFVIKNSWDKEKIKKTFKEFFVYLKSKGLRYWSPGILSGWNPKDNEGLGDKLLSRIQRSFKDAEDIAVGWLNILMENVDATDLITYKFRHKDVDNGTKAVKSISKKADFVIQNAADLSPSAEDSLVLFEEEEAKESRLIELKLAISRLPLHEKRRAQAFLRGEDVDASALSSLVGRLKTIMVEQNAS